MVTLIGLGCGDPNGMTAEARSALEEAELLIGAQRLLDMIPETGARRVPEYRPEAILETLREDRDRRACVAYSGDTGLFSGAGGLIPLLEREGLAFRVLPGISSVQLLAARLGLPWQHWRLCSAHGRDCDPVRELLRGQDVFFLTGGRLGPAELCRRLSDAGLGEYPAVVGERLSCPGERILRVEAVGNAAESPAGGAAHVRLTLR